MELIARLRAWALARPRVLLVDVPGEVTLRWSVEAELDRRGWRLAVSPADADLLLVLGEPGPELAAAVDVLWSQIPEPRHRVDVLRDSAVAAGLDAGLVGLVERAAGGAGRDDRPSPASALAQDADDEGMDHGGGHEGIDHGGGHEGMDHGGEVAGLPMASTGPDRDGLELDVLEVALGPVLPGWPTGLVLRAELHGDVLASAKLAWLDPGILPAASPPPEAQPAALDRLARYLDVAGWPAAAREARRARDGLATGGPGRGRAQRLAEAVARRVRRSRALSWTASGVGKTASGHGADEDTSARMRRWCDIASGRPVDGPVATSLEQAAAMVEGAEIGSARLVLASLDLGPVPAVPAPGHAHA